MHPFAGNLPSVTIHLKDANPDDIQFFIDELPGKQFEDSVGAAATI